MEQYRGQGETILVVDDVESQWGIAVRQELTGNSKKEASNNRNNADSSQHRHPPLRTASEPEKSG